MDPDKAPPEAQLVKLVRQAKGITAAKAAELAGGVIGPVRWRDIERGYGTTRGIRTPSRASDRALAHMAFAVGISPDRLAATGRTAAADVLAEIMGQEQQPLRPDATDAEIREWIARVRPASYQDVLTAINLLTDDDGKPLPREVRISKMNKWRFDNAAQPGETGMRAIGDTPRLANYQSLTGNPGL